MHLAYAMVFRSKNLKNSKDKCRKNGVLQSGNHNLKVKKHAFEFYCVLQSRKNRNCSHVGIENSNLQVDHNSCSCKRMSNRDFLVPGSSTVSVFLSTATKSCWGGPREKMILNGTAWNGAKMTLDEAAIRVAPSGRQ